MDDSIEQCVRFHQFDEPPWSVRPTIAHVDRQAAHRFPHMVLPQNAHVGDALDKRGQFIFTGQVHGTLALARLALDFEAERACCRNVFGRFS